MTTTMTARIPNDSYWNNTLSDQLFDIDELFSTAFDLFPSELTSTIIKQENDESSSSSEMDHDQQLMPIAIDRFPILICRVCGASASGYNFDQITCESCKAFFRRNALRNTSNLRCRFTGACVINIQTRRQCTYCRLKKCFDIQMRKDWIRTDEEKELRQLQKLAKERKKLNILNTEQQPLLNLPIVLRKKKRLKIKPVIQNLIINPIITQAFLGLSRDLSQEDRDLLNNITNAYQTIDDQAENLRIQPWVPPDTLIQFINEESVTHELLIRFYRTIPEFNQLDLKDRILLIKWNLVKIVHLHCILIHKFQEHPLMGKSMTRWMGADFHRQMSRVYQSFERFKEHPLILKLALIVFIFSLNLSGLNIGDSFDDFINRTGIYKIQECYTNVLWRHLNSIYDEKEAIRSMELIMTQILHYQYLMTIMEEYIQNHKDTTTVTIHELESSLFRLTI